MTRFHLWLMPTGGTCERLAAIIRHLSQKHGGPLFEPHVTLLGGMEGEGEEIRLQGCWAGFLHGILHFSPGFNR